MNKFSAMDDSSRGDWNIQIDRIVIDGIPLTSYQQQVLRESLEAELGRMFNGRGMPGGMGCIRGKVVGEPISLRESGAVPVQLGKQIAATVYNSLSVE